MKQMFESATLRLTGWYLLILVSISVLFSAVIYNISTSELRSRLEIFQTRLEGDPNVTGFNEARLRSFRSTQFHQSEANLLLALVYANLAILVAGGLGSYLLARRSLRPIEASHEAMSRFTSDASHELRTPLAVMKSELEVALRDTKLPRSEMRELLESNLEEVNRLSDLSHMLLQLSRNEYAEVEVEPLSLSSLAHKTIGLLNKTNHGRIDASIPKSNVQVQGNQAGLSELLMILLDNALRYSPPESTITLSLTEEKNNAIIVVTNSGDGIDPADIPHVFDRFYRGDKSRTSGNKSGYGLGLSLAKKIVEFHHGTIAITSEIGVSTSVKISLPRI